MKRPPAHTVAEIEAKVFAIAREQAPDVPPDQFTGQAKLFPVLGFCLGDFWQVIEEEFRVELPYDGIEDWQTFQEVVDFLVDHAEPESSVTEPSSHPCTKGIGQ